MAAHNQMQPADAAADAPPQVDEPGDAPMGRVGADAAVDSTGERGMPVILVDHRNDRSVAVGEPVMVVEPVARFGTDRQDRPFEIIRFGDAAKPALVQQDIVRRLVGAVVGVLHQRDLLQHKFQISKDQGSGSNRRSGATELIVAKPFEHVRTVSGKHPGARVRACADGNPPVLHRHVELARDGKFKWIALEDDVPDVGQHHIIELAAVLEQVIVIEKVPVIVDVDRLG